MLCNVYACIILNLKKSILSAACPFLDPDVYLSWQLEVSKGEKTLSDKIQPYFNLNRTMSANLFKTYFLFTLSWLQIKYKWYFFKPLIFFFIYRIVCNCWKYCLQPVSLLRTINIYFLEAAEYKYSHSNVW